MTVTKIMSVKEINVIWLQGQSCTGDTVSLTGATHPSLADLLTGYIPEASNVNLIFHPTLMIPHGEEAIEVLNSAAEGKHDPFVLVVEGSVPDEELAQKTGGFWCMVGEEAGKPISRKPITFNEWLTKLSTRCAALVALGTCASYGGIPKGIPNPTGSKGTLDFLGRDWKSQLGLPIICVPGCPAQGEHIAEVLAHLVLTARGLLPVPELDEENRPTFIFEKLAHEQCPRAGDFARGMYSEKFGESYCMGLLGCKGPIANCDVPKRGFIDGMGGCPTIGSPCIGCTMPDFPDPPFSPFLKKSPIGTYVTEVIDETKGRIKAVISRLKPREI